MSVAKRLSVLFKTMHDMHIRRKKVVTLEACVREGSDGDSGDSDI